MITVQAISKQEGNGNNQHYEIQFYANNVFRRIYPYPQMHQAGIMDVAVKFLHKSNLKEDLYFEVKGDHAVNYYKDGEVILVFAYHPQSNTGIWFTVEEKGGAEILESMTDRMPEIDIRSYVLNRQSIKAIMVDPDRQLYYNFYYFTR